MEDKGRKLTVSVIVPCHNAEHYLAAALDSLFGQDRPPDEVILVDDGSTDGSAGIAAGYMPGLRYHAQACSGAGSARNAGIRLATGDCIGFLDADDLWPANSLRHRVEALEANSALNGAAGLIEHFRTDSSGNDSDTSSLPPVQPTRLLGALLVRRAVFDRIGLFDASGRLGEAFDWLARLDDNAETVSVLDQIVLRRRVHAMNVGSAKRDRRGDYLHVLKSVIDRRRAAAQSAGPG